MNNFSGYGPYGFRPTEEELIGHLRKRTLLGRDYLVQEITDLGADICNWEPWDLPGYCKATSSDQEWYFIYPITYKHPNAKPKNTATNEGGGSGKRRRKRGRKPINRATKNGKWKIQGEFVGVRAGKHSKKNIGIKTRLYFYTSGDNNENNKKGKVKAKSSYQNKTPWVLYEYELIDIDPSQNKYFLGKLMKYQSEPTNMSSNKGETSQQLPSNCIENDHFPAQEVQQEKSLVEMEVSNGYDWIQIQSSEQTNEFVNPFPVVNYETYPEERSNFVSDGNYDIISNPRPSDLENSVPDYAVPQNLQLDYTELITNPEVPNVGIGDQNQLYTNQHDQYSFQNVFIDNDENYPEGKRNQHNIVAEDEIFNWPCDFSNYPITDMSQMNLYDLDGLYGLYLHELSEVPDATDNNGVGVQNQSSINQQASDGLCFHELFGVPEALDNNNGDGVQNQSSINQQVAETNSNVINNEIAYLDERSNQHNIIAAGNIEGSNFPSFSMVGSSYPMESSGKRSAMEPGGSSIDIESEVAQTQAQKSRF